MNRPHTVAIAKSQWLLADVFGRERVQAQVPMDVASADNPTSEPLTDVYVTQLPATAYPSRNPEPNQVLLVLEAADSSLRHDTTIKANLYARAGILDYWVVDIGARRLIVHREPRDGNYTSIAAYSEQESAAPLAATESPVAVAALLP